MTTVICDRRGMAADMRICGNITFKSPKIHRVNGALIGFCGDAEQALKFIEWRRNSDLRPTFNESGSFEALELSADGRLTLWGTELVGTPVLDDFYAIGSGAMCALAAMAMGAGLKRAIQIASRFDPNTGPDVQTMNLGGK
jgi:hypothetical protein